MLGIEYPIFQGGMAWIADAKLAAAVSNGGGLGIISAMNAGPDYLREQIALARALTDRPFGVNIMLMSPYADGVAETAAREGVSVITTGAGIPTKYMPRWKEAGIQVIPVVASVASAKIMERAGAAAVIAEGGESGGHIGETGTMALVPQVCDAVSIPVLAAGGIGDGRGVAAAFMLGAVGVQLGTRFLTAYECSVHRNYKEMVLKQPTSPRSPPAAVSAANTCRCLKNQFTRAFLSTSMPRRRRRNPSPTWASARCGKRRSRAIRQTAAFCAVRSPVWCAGNSPLPRSYGRSLRRRRRCCGGHRNGSDSVCLLRPGRPARGMGQSFYETDGAVKSLFCEAEALRPGTLRHVFYGQWRRSSSGRRTPSRACISRISALRWRCAARISARTLWPAFRWVKYPPSAFAGAFSMLDGFRIACLRGAFMAEAAKANPAAMLAVLRLGDESVEAICRPLPGAWPVNYNAPGQVVVSCAEASLPALREEVGKAGGKLMPLAVGGGFHCPLMAGAAGKFQAALKEFCIAKPEMPVYANCTASPYEEPAEELMVRQLTSPVHWRRLMRIWPRDGFDTFIETGVGSVLKGLVSRICRRPGCSRCVRRGGHGDGSTGGCEAFA
jgi:enoyl-[acyl-carrier protein] reductase II